jgi:hypothetical protein
MKQAIHDKIVDLSKLKKDGVYKKGQYYYAVIDHNFSFFLDSINGEIFQVFGFFHTRVGVVELNKRKSFLNFIKQAQ